MLVLAICLLVHGGVILAADFRQIDRRLGERKAERFHRIGMIRDTAIAEPIYGWMGSRQSRVGKPLLRLQ
jgi:hypothetical protein